MKYYRFTLSLILLVAFAAQGGYVGGIWNFTWLNTTLKTTSFCGNKDFQSKSKIEHNSSQNAEASCTASFNLLFLAATFSWHFIETIQTKLTNVSYRQIQEQLYVDKLLDPPQLVVIING